MAERFHYQLVDLADGKQMLARFHIGADGKAASTSVGIVLPSGPEDAPLTITISPDSMATITEANKSGTK